MVEKTFFPLIENVLALDRLSAEHVSEALKMSLFLGYSTKYFDIYGAVSSSDPDIEAVIEDLELRFPRPESRHNDGMLIITLTPALHISPDEVMSRFGEPELSLVESPPGEPIVPIMYYVYRHKGGKLSFQISRESNMVTGVVVDRIEGE